MLHERPIAEHRTRDLGKVSHLDMIADSRIRPYAAKRADETSAADTHMTFNHRKGADRRIAAYFHIGIDICRLGINDGHALQHKILENPSAHNRLGKSQI